MARILVVDDQRNMRTTLSLLLRRGGHDVDEAADGRAAIDRLAAEDFDLVITDLRMGEIDGLRVLREVKERASSTEVIVMTAYGTIENAVEAMRAGAFDYIQKPFNDEALLVKVERAVSAQKLAAEVSAMASEFRERYQFENLIGRSAAMRDVLGRIVRIAPTDATVLITGESGTGKELVARAIHANSSRADRPFITVNCAAITETLLESELFGHTRGAFTGAVQARKGLFEEANGGTFFFDEIAETPPSFQAKLLRAIQDGEVRRLGDNHSFNVDVRIIASTNQELREMIADKTFREDLYYRLNVARFILPPLRERKEDIGPLVEHFLDKYGRKMRRNARLGDGVLDYLSRYDFPGNIRELENLIEQGIALSVDGLIQLDDIITPEMRPDARAARAQRSLQDVVDAAEREAIRNVLREVDGNKERAAELLGLSSTTLWRKMKRLDVVWPS
ncbi:MAG: sigma-54-dependent Fis family transcriptional regulator [Myxococcales bacterium]|nr:sigma-54-dependent Fis family transcriptional regulator [Myxococcales bacterium]